MVELYLPMFVMFAIVAVIASVMFLGGQFVGPKNPTPEKMTSFECGNDTEGAGSTRHEREVLPDGDPVRGLRYRSRVHVPWAALFKGLGWTGFFSMFGFIVALIVALAYCWKKGALEWET